MTGVHIVTDSSCDLSEAETTTNGIGVVPLNIRFGDDEYIDREQLSVEDFYAKMASTGLLPETSAPSPGRFEQAFRGAAAVGATIYFGSEDSSRQIVEVAQAFERAHELGMATILWCYLRNSGFKKDGVDYHTATDITAQANHLGVTIQADIIKQKLINLLIYYRLKEVLFSQEQLYLVFEYLEYDLKKYMKKLGKPAFGGQIQQTRLIEFGLAI